MNCPKCDAPLVIDPDRKYNYQVPFVPARDHCLEHGYQPVPPPIHFAQHSKKEPTNGKR